MERYFSKLFSRSKYLAILELGRIWNSTALALISVVGVYISTDPTIFELILFPLIWIFLYLGAASINDVHDSVADKVNMPYRPIPSGRITHKEAEIIAFSMFMIGNLIAYWFFGLEVLVLAFIFTLLSLLYSIPPFSVVSRGILAQLKLSFLSVFLPFYAGVVYGLDRFIIPTSLFLPIFSVMMLYTFLSITKDFKDVEGDRKQKKNTFLICVGHDWAMKTSLIGTLIFYPVSIYLFYNLFRKTSLVALLTAIFIATLYEHRSAIVQGEKTFTKIRILFLCLIVILLIYSMIFDSSYAASVFS